MEQDFGGSDPDADFITNHHAQPYTYIDANCDVNCNADSYTDRDRNVDSHCNSKYDAD